MTAARVVVVDPYSSGAMLAAPLRRAGFEPVAVTSFPNPSDLYRAAFRPGDFTHVLSADHGVPALVRQLTALRPIAVVAGSESGVILADTLAHALTPTRSNSFEHMSARRHKGEMVRALERCGVPTIRSTWGKDVTAMRRWAETQGLLDADLVVKPVMSGGSEGLTLVPAGGDLESAVHRLLGLVDALGTVTTEVILQERTFGTEYVVDTFSYDGVHTVTNICRYSKVSDELRFAVYESMEFLPFDAPGNAALIAYVERALHALGVRFGLAHCEVMATADGLRLIEVGARVPGAGLPGACTVATGENGIDRLVRHLGAIPVRSDFELERAVMVVYFIATRTGVISNVGAYEQVARLPSCRHLRLNVHDGDRVWATSHLLSTMSLGWALLAHRSPQQVDRDHRAIRELERHVEIDDRAMAGDVR